jgi:hypothetical protein
MTPTVFVSYASEDREAARLIGEALPAYGLEVWLDESELGGGDAWDQKIRRQIRECDYFMALVSAQTEARHEGYFRREWRLAVERTLDMADDHLFLLPVVIDETVESRARVPEKFLSVQWLKLPGGQPTPALESLCRRLVSGEPAASSVARKTSTRPIGPTPARSLEFPREEPGQRVRFWFQVIGWTFSAGMSQFRRLPRWVRIVIIIWVVIWAVKLASDDSDNSHRDSSGLSAAQEKKLKRISQQYQGGADKLDLGKLATQIAQEFSDDENANTSDRATVLAIPFSAPSGDAAAQSIADSTFAQVYGRISISHGGKAGLEKDPLASCPLEAVLARARAVKSAYAVCGSIDTEASGESLNIKIAKVSNRTVLWSMSYPLAGADPEKIAAEVNSKVPAGDDE